MLGAWDHPSSDRLFTYLHVLFEVLTGTLLAENRVDYLFGVHTKRFDRLHTEQGALDVIRGSYQRKKMMTVIEPRGFIDEHLV